MATLSDAIHQALSVVEAWIHKVEGEHDMEPAPVPVTAAIAKIRLNADHLLSIAGPIKEAPEPVIGEHT